MFGRFPFPEPLFILLAFLLAFNYAVVAQENIAVYSQRTFFLLGPGQCYRNCFPITMSATPIMLVQKGFLDTMVVKKLTPSLLSGIFFYERGH